MGFCNSISICPGYTLQIRRRSHTQNLHRVFRFYPRSRWTKEYFINKKNALTDVGDAGLQNHQHEHTTSAASLGFNKYINFGRGTPAKAKLPSNYEIEFIGKDFPVKNESTLNKKYIIKVKNTFESISKVAEPQAGYSRKNKI